MSETLLYDRGGRPVCSLASDAGEQLLRENYEGRRYPVGRTHIGRYIVSTAFALGHDLQTVAGGPILLFETLVIDVTGDIITPDQLRGLPVRWRWSTEAQAHIGHAAYVGSLRTGRELIPVPGGGRSPACAVVPSR